MTASATPNRAAAFLAMHRPGAGFILPNAWDGGRRYRPGAGS